MSLPILIEVCHNGQRCCDVHYFDRRPFHSCPSCNAPFQHVQRLRAHINLSKMYGCRMYNQFTKRYKCPKCPRAFRHPSEFVKHINRRKKCSRVNRLSPCSSYPCPSCNAPFKYVQKLQAHVKLSQMYGCQMYDHITERYKCPQCPRTFNLPSEFIKHIPKHSGKTSIECRLCGVCYRYRSGLSYHMKAHHGGGGECKEKSGYNNDRKNK